ncbi:hypothetical protein CAUPRSCDRAFT_12578, partial [Caulochytrium protostelioides]
MFLALRASELFKAKIKNKVSDKIKAKLKGNSFIQSLRITDISLGEHAPMLHGVRLVKGVTDDLAVTAEFDTTYMGGASVAIECTLTGNIRIPVRVFLGGLSGKLRVRMPSRQWGDMVAVTFAEDPKLTFTVDSTITVRENEIMRGMVNQLLGKITRRMFVEMWVLPAWRTFFLPSMTPSFE